MLNKKNETLIDLIVPVYHNNETLMRLFASIVTQTMRKVIKIILVQDCDGEDYSEIISNFKNMLDIELLSLEYNCGPGACRRKGMQHGTSKYIMFMDADDTFQNPFAVQELFEFIENNKLDVVNSTFLEEISECRFVPHNNDYIWVFGKIYKRKFLEENKIYFNDSRANEDTGFNSVVFEYGKVGTLNDITYIWWYKEDSITRVDDGIYRFTGLEGWLYNMEWSTEELTRLGLAEDRIKMKVARNIMNTYCWYLEFIHDEDPRVDINKYLEWVDKFVINTYNKHIPTNQMLEEVYNEFSNNEILKKFIPTITFKDYIKMVGGEEWKEEQNI